jgi:hypothetical protein
MEKCPQRNPTDCGICALAMVLGLPYDFVIEKVFPNGQTRNDFSIPFDNFPQILRSFNRNGVIRDKIEEHLNGILEISYSLDGKTVWHYIAYDAAQKDFIDPQTNPPPKYTKHRFLEVL